MIETAAITMKWVLFVVYVGGSGMLRMEPVATGFHTFQACKQAAQQMSQTAKKGRFDCTWYRDGQ